MVKQKLLGVGADPGSAHGAVAVIDSDLNVLELINLPCFVVLVKSKRVKSKLNKTTGKYELDYKKRSWTDAVKTGEIFKKYEKTQNVYTVEKVGTRPGEGETSSFIFGNSFGILQAQCTVLQPVRYYEPLPTLWKPELGVTSDKSTSIFLANEIFGDSLKELNITLRCKKSKVNKDDDLAEALLLAYYGISNYLKEVGKI